MASEALMWEREENTREGMGIRSEIHKCGLKIIMRNWIQEGDERCAPTGFLQHASPRQHGSGVLK
jgi:hypothetical protein